MEKRLLLLAALFVGTMAVHAQWTDAEIASANTAQNVSYLSYEEKMVYLYTNLARMYPKKFADLEVEHYDNSSSYKTSLLRDLRSLSARKPLCFGWTMYESAKCFAEETAQTGKVGHDRTYCAEHNVVPGSELYGVGENCSYGHNIGLEIVMQLLIDEGVTSLGHRENCLRSDYCVLGVSINSHPTYRHCCVMDFKLCDNTCNAHASVDCELTKRVNAASAKTIYLQSIGADTDANAIISDDYSDNSTNNSSSQGSSDVSSASTSRVTGSTSQSNTTTSGTSYSSRSTTRNRKTYRSVLDSYYDYSGRSFLSFIDANYTYGISEHQHIVSAGIASFRTTMVGVSLFNFEMIVSPLYKAVAYKPILKLYFPFCNQASINAYGGVAVDMSKLWERYLDEPGDNYGCGLCGVSLTLNSLKVMPLEIFAEYRIPWQGTMYNRGFFVGAQLSLGKPKNKS